MNYIIAIVVAAGALVLYFRGVQKGVGWAVPMMVVLLAVSVGVLVYPMTPLPRMLAQRRQAGEREGAWEHLGERLADELPSEVNALAVMRGTRERPAPRDVPDFDSFSKGAGVDLDMDSMVFFEDVSNVYDAPDFNGLLKDYEGEQVDIIFSMAGIPTYQGRYELEQLECLEWDSAPLFVAVVRQDFDRKGAERYLDDGLLDALIFQSEAGEWVVAAGPGDTDELQQ